MQSFKKFASISAGSCKALNAASGCSALAIAMLSGVSAHAQEAGAAPDADIIVTGSRVKSSFEQPTPVAIKTAEDPQSAQPASIAYALVQAPQFAGSTTSRTLPGSAQQRSSAVAILICAGLG